MRRGGPQLRESQVYPRGYGRQVHKIHCEHVVSELKVFIYYNVCLNVV